MTFRMNYLTIALLAGFGLALGACGGGGDAAPPTTEVEVEPTPPDLGPARMATMTAAIAADTAADAAEAAVMAQDANMAADAASYAIAQNAAERARTAATAAAAANTAAQAATTLEAAEAQRDIAQAAQATAEAEQANAEKYAGMVADAQQVIDDENQRQADVADARSRAAVSYELAEAAATKAEMQADEAEAAAPNSPGAMAARTAAMEARRWAVAAKTAHDAIMDDMTKEQADAQADTAAEGAASADYHYRTAKAQNDTIQTNVATVNEQNRARDVADATDAAETAATAARDAATTARMAATNARDAANAANDAYLAAVAARTNSEEAKKQADAADLAATAAEMAADAAEMAADAAEAAHMGIDAEGSASDAQTAQMTAETAQETAETQRDMASTQLEAAETGQVDAELAVDTHVLQLFLAANGAHVMDLESTMNVDEKAAHVRSVGAAMAAIAAVTAGNQTASTAVTITWLGDTVDNPTTDDDEFVAGNLGITVNVAGTTEIVAEFGADRAADNTVTPEVTQRIQTAKAIADLGRFQGYELWEDDGDDTATSVGDRARAIVFTNKQKGDNSVLAVVGGAARSVSGQAVTASELSNVGGTGNTITGVTWTPSGEPPLTGTLSCTGDACNLVLGEDGAVATITGYTFTGSRGTVEAVTAADATEDNDYLAFGLWLEESDNGATDTFGSFAVGGTDYAVNVQNAVTGTAEYSGKAAGAHHKTGHGVNWFDGDASLTANFGAADAPGTVSGAISNIRVAGGDPMSASIYLGQADLTDGTAIFNGAAFMGAATAPGASTHEFDGTWSGSFFGATENDTDTADVDESITAPLAAAGTFGVTKSEGTGNDMVVESFVGAFGANKE